MNYNEIVAALQTMLEIPLNQSDENFTRILPAMFRHAEGRIFGDVQVLVTNVTQQITLPALQREVQLPLSVRIVEQISVLTPAMAWITPQSKRTVLERVPPVYIDMAWPQASFQPGIPQKFALIGTVPMAQPLLRGYPLRRAAPHDASADPPSQGFSYLVRLMPVPDKNYPAEVTGTIRPEALSQANPETFLTIRYPELFLASCMIYGCGYQRDFSAQADDPARAMSWEAQYAALLRGVLTENARMRGEGPDFTSLPPAQLSKPPRAP